MHNSSSSDLHPFRLARWFLLLALLTCIIIVFPADLAAQQPMLIPQPRELQKRPQPFQVKPGLKIVLLTPIVQEDFFAAERVERELKFVTGHEFPIVGLPEPPQGLPAIVMGRFGQPVMRRLLTARNVSTEGIGNQGYVLDVDPTGIVLAGKDGAGLFYGVQTLRQLVVPASQEAEILGVRIRDWPALKYRGTQVDLSRGPVPRLNYLKTIVRTIAQFKMNQLFIYMEDSYRLQGQPLWGILSDTLTRSDWNRLVSYAARYHVTIVPRTEDCGHLHKVLRFQEYSDLAERPHGYVLAPVDPHERGFLNRMYGQLLPVFPSAIYFVGCDETFSLGMGRSKALVKREGYGKVYVDHLNRVAKLVESYKKKVIFSGDIATEHPEMIPSLPKDQMVDCWVYSAHQSYMKWLKPFQGTGLKIIISPWVGNTSVIVPDYEEAAYNIEHLITDGKKVGAIGTIIKVWNDDGETMYSPGWWSIVYGAACAWEPGLTHVQDFNRKFDWDFFRDMDPGLVKAMMSLSHINEIMRAGKPVETYDMRYGGASDRLFWRNPFSALGRREALEELPVASLIRMTAERDYTVFVNDASMARRNVSALTGLKFAALRLGGLAMRYQYLEEISERYQNAVAHANGKNRRLVYSDLSDIDSTNGRLQDLRDYTTKLTELYRELWLSENLPTWMPNMLRLYYHNSDLWQNLIAKYSTIQVNFSEGKPLPSPESLGLLTKEQLMGLKTERSR